jgi:uncharacterized repeat protein (TIGR03803 family)
MRGLQLCRLFAFGFVVWAVATSTIAHAQKFTSLASFNGTDGASPERVNLAQGLDGNLYGTAMAGGKYGQGVIFKITPSGTLTDIYDFCANSNCPDGSQPLGGVTLGLDGNLYGVASNGGANGEGEVYKFNPAAKTLSVLHSFNTTDGANPPGWLIQGSGVFYGTTQYGGASGSGTVFKITTAGVLTTLHNFDGTDGSIPGGVVMATSGILYGTTYQGGTYGGGTIFKLTTTGVFTSLHSFTGGSDGSNPNLAPTQAANGYFYGTTQSGGAGGGGVVYRMTPAGGLTTIANPGGEPIGGVTQATDGNFYGVTYQGGRSSCGTIFRIKPNGGLSTLHAFDCSDGYLPFGALTQATNGTLYGTTFSGNGGTANGTVFSESLGLGPFVEALTNAGKVGAKVIVLGSSLTGSTAVAFNGTAATFKVVSGTEITANVPAGATTGMIKVTTPSGVLSSNATYRVTPQILSFRPTSGPIGTVVTITGVSLTQTTKVTFGGVKASTFTVNSDTQVTATVPTGAMTGHIAITTLGGTAVSSGVFTVTQ